MTRRDVLLALVAVLCTYAPPMVSAAPAASSDVQPDRAEPHSNNFKDNFSGTQLQPKWNVLNEDTDRWTLVQGDYLLLVPTRSHSHTVDVNRFVYRDSSLLPQYDVILKVKGGVGDNVHVMLSIAKDDSNEIVMKYVGSDRFYFSKIMGGTSSDYQSSHVDIKDDADFYLKISKRDVEYTGLFSRDGQTWSKVGLHAFLRLDGLPTFGAFLLGTSPERPTKIDYFEIQDVK
jgi:hypothetical protein